MWNRIKYYWKQFIDIFTYHQLLKISKNKMKIGQWYFCCGWIKAEKEGFTVETIYLLENSKGFKKKDIARLKKMGAIK